MTLILGDCLEKLRELEADSIDAVVTDPPAGISFMGKSWDSDKGGRDQWIAWMREAMEECLRVLKPGAHGLVWSLPRTSYWTATALENAGFEIRDCVTHLFGSGFPKSLDVSKAIDKAAGVQRPSTPLVRCDGKLQHNKEGGGWKQSSEKYVHHPIFDGSTDAAKQWQGWGTALKPAAEFWWLVRKPISEKTVAANVQRWGTGAINIDAGRIAGDGLKPTMNNPMRHGRYNSDNSHLKRDSEYNPSPLGRFPANLVLSGDAIEMLGEPARFFYCAKISSGERNAGLEEMPDLYMAGTNQAVAELKRGNIAFESDGAATGFSKVKKVKNNHPTVKPKKLMAYLIKLITPPGGTVLDPFMGSGSTGIACKENGFQFIGIEREPEYFEIAKARVGCP